MIGGVKAPTTLLQVPNPELSLEQKLADIADAPVTVHPLQLGDDRDEGTYIATLPHVFGLSFCPPGRMDFGSGDRLWLQYFNLVDPDLLVCGIGSRLLKTTIRHCVDEYPDLVELYGESSELGFVNTAVAVLGASSVRVQNAGDDYGMGTGVPLDQMFDDWPHRPGKSYQVEGLVGRIDRTHASGWEKPDISGKGYPGPSHSLHPFLS